MSIVNFTSGINKIEETRSLSEWAVEYISSYKLTRENYGKSEGFRVLSRQQKDAIRYQLRKATPVMPRSAIRTDRVVVTPNAAGSRNRKRVAGLRIGLSVWISCFLLMDIIKIYSDKGLSPSFAWQVAILVEVCILVASLCHEERLRKIAYAFFIYNAALFAFSEVTKIIRIHDQNNYNSKKLSENYRKKDDLSAALKSMNKFRDKSFSEMSKLVGKGYVSSVSNAVTRINSGLNISEQNTQSELRTLEKEISEYESEMENLFAKGLISFLYFVLRCALQLFAIWLLKTPKQIVVSRQKLRTTNVL